jgi:hypothetical protein
MLYSSFLPERLRLLPGKTVLLVLVSAALGAGLTAGIPPLVHWLEGTKPNPAPAPLLDKRFIPLGRDYTAALGQQYAAAWVEGAKALEAGQSVPSALKSVAQTWDHGRTKLFGRLLTPEFSKIVPEGQSESDTQAAARLAMAQAWRGLAAGLASRRWLINWP